MTDQILDFTRSVRRAASALRRTCQHAWSDAKAAGHGGRRGRTERCTGCGEAFPCRGWACMHIDCIARGIELGQRAFPRSFPVSIRQLTDGHTGTFDTCAACTDTCGEDHYYLIVDLDTPPEDWLLPVGWKLTPLEGDLR